ncbi:hypothetical protein GCM10010912_10380 [Paenibacillus albidus]|uniref:DUF2384 domain-containing protein n=1 Tax=Paenibacillus albidus TaxID=2041023 RepID=A0A917FCY0_9BACL|nr:antitoxin Xre/MbcA/ParS toxin-binding domain-containing protein [Paenibacillus albidus]GGF67347.1 hypothetical protein GCM10010912_10380 [Paenibacillus albidus]
MREIYLKEFKEDSWEEMVQLYQELYNEVEPGLRTRVESSGIPEDILRVLLPDMGEYLLTWMEEQVPALGYEKPSDYLKTAEGTRALKSAILRMPR